MKAEDVDAGDGADSLGDARDLRAVLPLAEVRNGLEKRSVHGGSALPERAIQVYRGADKREVGEGLGEVAQGLASTPELLGIELQMVGVGEHLLQGEARLLEASGLREALHEPERAEAKA